jgi:Flp pilus assembly pilin Flp
MSKAQDMVEYALLLGLISVMSLPLIISSGTKISQTWSFLDSALGTAAGS